MCQLVGISGNGKIMAHLFEVFEWEREREREGGGEGGGGGLMREGGRGRGRERRLDEGGREGV